MKIQYSNFQKTSQSKKNGPFNMTTLRLEEINGYFQYKQPKLVSEYQLIKEDNHVIDYI